MKTQTAIPFVDTNIVPDRNAGIGSLLWDLQNPRDPDGDGPPLLDPAFAFIDVGVSRARVATALKDLLASDLGMDVDYVATERLEAAPYANVGLVGDRAEKIRGHLSAMISSNETVREATNWHYVVDRRGKVSSVAYSYRQHGNEVWEAHFMGRAFMVSGEAVEFREPALDEMLAHDVPKIEAKVDLEMNRDSDPSQPGPSWDGYRVERDPLKTGLAESGIALQRTDIPRRIEGRQNVMFLGNVLNHYPHDERSRALDRIAASMEEGDLVIVQADETEESSVEVLRVKGRGAQATRERVRSINTKNLEVLVPVRGRVTSQRIRMKPELERLASRLTECLGKNVNFPEWSGEEHNVLAHRYIRHVFAAYFRALPVEETFRIAVRDALRRLPSEAGLKGVPIFKDDVKDAYGGALGLDPTPIVSGADLIDFGLSNSQDGLGMIGERPWRSSERS